MLREPITSHLEPRSHHGLANYSSIELTNIATSSEATQVTQHSGMAGMGLSLSSARDKSEMRADDTSNNAEQLCASSRSDQDSELSQQDIKQKNDEERYISPTPHTPRNVALTAPLPGRWQELLDVATLESPETQVYDRDQSRERGSNTDLASQSQSFSSQPYEIRDSHSPDARANSDNSDRNQIKSADTQRSSEELEGMQSGQPLAPLNIASSQPSRSGFPFGFWSR